MKRALFFLLLAFAGIVACATSSSGKVERLCTPGNYVFCRCANRQEGSKLCKDDGQSFEKCDPCDALGLGEDPDPGPPPADFDGSAPLPGCGNGVADQDEDCDDKNAVDDDGCTKDCKLSTIAQGNGAGQKSTSCPGMEVHVWGGAHKPQTTGSTIGSGNRSASPTCTGQIGNSTTGAAAGDRVFRVVAHKTGQMSVSTSDTNYDSFLYAASSCATDAGGDIKWSACVNGVNGNGGETLSFPVDDGKTYYVFVDGAGISGNQGNFRVTFTIP